MAKSNGFPEDKITKPKTQLITKARKTEQPTSPQKWVAFTHFSPAVRMITNIFKKSNIGIAFRTTNTIFKQLFLEGCTNQDPSSIYKIKCNTCNKAYVGQTGRAISVRYIEHIRYIRTNNPQSAYATHILQNRHEFGPQNETLQSIKACTKRMRMNCCQSMFIKNFHRKGMLIREQQPYDHNPF